MLQDRKNDFSQTICAILLSAFIFYTQFYQYVVTEISGVATLLGGAVIGVSFFFIYNQSINLYVFFGKDLGQFFLFWIVVLFTGAIGSIGYAGIVYHIKHWMVYFLYFLLIPSMMYIVMTKKDVYLFAEMYALFSLFCAIKLILYPVAYYETSVVTDVRYSIGKTCNVNQLGMYFSLGTWCMLLLMSVKPKLRIPGGAYMLIMLYANNMTQSRKNLIAMVTCVGLWFMLIWYKDHKQQSLYIMFLLPFLIIGGYIVYLKLYQGTNIQLRMQDLFNRLKTGDTSRIKMYKNAMAMFFEHPIFGFGIGGYGERYGGYTHATYAELPACTGLMGCVLYLVMYIKSIIRVFRLIRISNGNESLKVANMLLRMSLILWAIIVFMSASVVYFYELFCFITFGILFATIRYAEWEIRDVYREYI